MFYEFIYKVTPSSADSTGKLVTDTTISKQYTIHWLTIGKQINGLITDIHEIKVNTSNPFHH